MTECEIILQALIEYEEEKWAYINSDEQDKLNRLISDYKNKVKQEGD